jgi:hypothetical protein
MNLLALRKRLREMLDDYEGKERFSTGRVDDALKQAQTEACRRADLIIDSTTEAICKIKLLPQVAYYPIDPSIKKIKQVRHANENEHCQRHRILHQVDLNHKRNRGFWGGFDTLRGTSSGTGCQYIGRGFGRPDEYILDKETGALFLDRCPEIVGDYDFLSLTVIRLPITRMVKEADVPEILEQFHLPMCYWAASLLLSDNDPETYDPSRADRYEAKFTAEFGDPVTANNQMQRLNNKKLRAQASFL